MRLTRVMGVLVGLLTILGLVPATATASTTFSAQAAVAAGSRALPLVIVVRGLNGQAARIRVTGPRSYDRTFRVSTRKRLTGLRPGRYRLRSRAVGKASASDTDQRVRITRRQGVKVFFKYRVPVPPVPPTPAVPGPLTDLRATSVSATAITLAWTNPASGFSGVRVNRTGGPGSIQVTPAQNGLTDSGLLPATAYTYTLTPVGSGGDGPASTITVTTSLPGVVASGGNASCGITAAGTLKCWGSGPSLGTAADPSLVATGVQGPAGSGTTAIARGADHTCAINTGTIFCWGTNTNGQVGTGNTTTTLIPVAVPLPAGPPAAGIAAPTRAVAIAAGDAHSCAIADNAMLYCWGAYGPGAELTPTYVPIQVGSDTGPSFRGVRHVDAGGAQTCVTTTNNRLSCFGPGPAAEVLGLSGTFTGIAVGDAHACVLTSSGAAFCWGANGNGQLGTGGNLPSPTPVAVAGNHTFRELAAGSNTSCGITSSGTALCWGAGGYGQVGNGTLADSNTPTLVQAPGAFFTAISAGTTSCGVVSGTTAMCWGRGTQGQIGNGGLGGSATPLAVNGY